MMDNLPYIILITTGPDPERTPEFWAKYSDEELVAHICDTRDSQIFSLLYDRYEHKVYRRCMSFVKNKDEAKDLTQDIFLKVYLKLATFDPLKGSFSTWLYAITNNSCNNYITRFQSKMKSFNAASQKVHESNGEQELDLEELDQLDVDKFNTALELIPPGDKSLLLLKYKEDTPIRDLKNLMGISESAVKMRLNRAKLRVTATYNKL